MYIIRYFLSFTDRCLKMDLAGAESTSDKYATFLNLFHLDVKRIFEHIN